MNNKGKLTTFGFTIPELMVSLVGFSFLIGISVFLFSVLVKESQSTFIRNDLRQDALLAAERFSRDINEAHEITSAQASSITYWWQDTDADGVRDANELITFSWAGVAGNPFVRSSVNIVPSVNNLTFSYRDVNNAVLTPAPDLTRTQRDSIRRIEIQMTLSDQSEQVTVVTAVMPRNLRQTRGPW